MKRFNAIDVLKFFMSFFVVAIHTDADNGLITRYICPLVVPMFFAISGFLLQEHINLKVMRTETEIYRGGIIKHYIKKLLFLYILWTAIYLPWSYYGYCIVEGKSFLRATAILLRNIFVTGQNYMSWPLWYLWALIISVLMVGWLRRLKWSMGMIVLLGILANALGEWMNTVRADCDISWLSHLLEIYYAVFVNTMNGFFGGLGYVATGMWLSMSYGRCCRNDKLMVFFLVVAVALYASIPIGSKYVLFFFMLYLITKIQLDDRPCFLWFRKMSTWIYFAHMLFVAPVILWMPQVTPGVERWALSSFGVCISGGILIALSRYPRLALLKRLVG